VFYPTRIVHRTSSVEFRVWKWIRAQTVDWLSTASKVSGPGHDHAEVWKERKDAEIALRNYLSELPSASPPNLRA
jgi:hypothetical protein